MSDIGYLYASMVTDDLPASVSALEHIGLVKTWAGRHPLFNCDAVMCAAQRGGLLVFQLDPAAHPAVAAYAGQKERMFNFALTSGDGAAQRKRCEESKHVESISPDYEGPCGTSFAVELRVAGKDRLWIEFIGDAGAAVGAPGSTFLRMESTAMVAPKRADIVDALESIGLSTDRRADNGYFPVIAAINRVVIFPWHYLEVNEPTGEGVMSGLLARIGGAGIFGLNMEPADMSRFLADARQHEIATNSPEPILLKVEVAGTMYDCADIITVNPRSTGGARIFVLKPIDYPWRLVGAP